MCLSTYNKFSFTFFARLLSSTGSVIDLKACAILSINSNYYKFEKPFFCLGFNFGLLPIFFIHCATRFSSV